MSRNEGRGGGLIRTTITTAFVVIVVLVGAGFLVSKLWGLPFSTTTKDHSPPPVLLDLRTLSDYHAAQAQFEVVVDHEDDVRWIPQVIAGERAQYVAVGTVDAIVDFSTVGTSAIEVSEDGESVVITLPRATLMDPVLDPENSHLMNRDRGIINRVTGLFTDSPTSEADLQAAAVEKMADAALQTNLLQTAEDNTKSMLYTMMRQLGFSLVDIRFEGESPSDLAVMTD